MNKRHNLYVVFEDGAQISNLKEAIKRAEHTFDHIKEARKFARRFPNPVFYEVHYSSDSCDILWYKRVGFLAKKRA